MKANGKMIFITVSENYKDLMALFILENSKMIWKMEKENKDGQTDKNIMEIGKMMRKMAKDKLFIKIKILILENWLM